MISFAIVPTSRLIRAESTFTLPKNCVGAGVVGGTDVSGTGIAGVVPTPGRIPAASSVPGPAGFGEGIGRSASNWASADALLTSKPTASELKPRTCPPRKPR
jgi:hypothetical protein